MPHSLVSVMHTRPSWVWKSGGKKVYKVERARESHRTANASVEPRDGGSGASRQEDESRRKGEGLKNMILIPLLQSHRISCFCPPILLSLGSLRARSHDCTNDRHYTQTYLRAKRAQPTTVWVLNYSFRDLLIVSNLYITANPGRNPTDLVFPTP